MSIEHACSILRKAVSGTAGERDLLSVEYVRAACEDPTEQSRGDAYGFFTVHDRDSRPDCYRVSERVPAQKRTGTSKYKHLFTEKVLRVFKEEGIADEEAMTVLSRMFDRSELPTSVLSDGSYIFRYCDERRYLMNKILNRVAAERERNNVQRMPAHETEARGSDFDPRIDILTGRPVGL